MNEQERKQFAFELASTLQDVKSLGVYEIFVANYTEDKLREILRIVMNTPIENIKRSRAAYFTYLVKHRNF